ncbi:MAG: transposase [Dokdonella sp.]
MSNLISRIRKRRSYFERKARRSYWQVHLNAWLQSGVTRQEYCDEHRLNRATMMRWIRALEVPIPKRRIHPKRPPLKFALNRPRPYTIAFKAFCLMHAEARLESGLTVGEYARAHSLSERTVRKYTHLLAALEPTQDWREMLHPSNRPPGRYRFRLRDKLRTSGVPNSTQEVPAAAVPGKRRQFTDQQKLAIVAEFSQSGVTASIIARRHNVTPAMVFRWRDEFNLSPKKQEHAMLLTAQVVDRPTRGRPRKPLVLEDLLPMPAGAITVELADGRRVYAPAGTDPDRVRQYITQQESTS